jgi:alpha-amylase
VRAFNSTTGNITALVEQIGNMNQACKNIFALGTFSENHDLPRFASFTPDVALAQNMLAFDVMIDGIPVGKCRATWRLRDPILTKIAVYYGQEQHFDGAFNPVNREAMWLTKYDTSGPLHNATAGLNKIRNHAMQASDSYATYITNIIHHDNQTLVLRKGDQDAQTITVLSNLGADSQGVPTLDLQETDFGSGQKVMDVLSCQESTVGDDGILHVDMNGGAARVFYPSDNMDGSGLCGFSGGKSSNSGGNGNSSSGDTGDKNGATTAAAHSGLLGMVMGSLLLAWALWV